MHEQHRKRLDEKLEKFGLEGLAEHEQLELILYTVIPRRDTNKLAHTLLDIYGTLHSVLTADIKDLETIEGIGHRTAVFLHCLPQISGAVQRSLFETPARLITQEDIENYVKSFFFGKLTEEAYMFCLNGGNRLICFYKLSKGTGEETSIYPSHVLKKAILTEANKVVIAHNHPFGDSKPSHADISTSQRIAYALDAVGIKLRDSLIVARGECFSLEEHGYFRMIPKFREGI